MRSTSGTKLALLLAFAPLAHAALWESNDWALTGKVDGALGYDSNLTTSNNGPADYYIFATPYVTLARRNSSTDFHVNAGATHTEYINGELPAQTDFHLDATYAYPQADNVVPIYRVDAAWQRTAPPDQYLGLRIQTDETSFDSEGFLPLTGKLGLRGSATVDSEKYDSRNLNHNVRGDIALGLAFQRTNRSELSLNLAAVSGHSTPNNSANTANEVKTRGYTVTLRLRGELTAKLSGSVYGGFGQADFTGGYTNTLTRPIGGAELTWKIDLLRTLAVDAFSGVRYSPDGQTNTLTRVALSYTHIVFGQWQYTLQAGMSHSKYSRTVQYRTDDSIGLGAEIAYQPSTRFRVALGLNNTNQTSNDTFATFKRSLVSLGSTYRF